MKKQDLSCLTNAFSKTEEMFCDVKKELYIFEGSPMLDSVLIISHTPEYMNKSSTGFQGIEDVAKEISSNVQVLVPKNAVVICQNLRKSQSSPNFTQLVEMTVNKMISDHLKNIGGGDQPNKNLTIVVLEANLGNSSKDISFERSFFEHAANDYPHVHFILFSGSPDAMKSFEKNVQGLSNVFQRHIDKIEIEKRLAPSELKKAFESEKKNFDNALIKDEKRQKNIVPHESSIRSPSKDTHDAQNRIESLLNNGFLNMDSSEEINENVDNILKEAGIDSWKDKNREGEERAKDASHDGQHVDKKHNVNKDNVNHDPHKQHK